MNTIEILLSLGACHQAIMWASEQPDQSPQRLWETCPRGDWLAWYLGRLAAPDGHGSPAHKRATLIACFCARTASVFWRDPACELAVAMTERWAWGDETVTIAALDAAADSIASVGHVGHMADAAYAAYAAAALAHADDAAAYAALAVSAAARDDDDIESVRMAHLASIADMIRSAIPEVPS